MQENSPMDFGTKIEFLGIKTISQFVALIL